MLLHISHKWKVKDVLNVFVGAFLIELFLYLLLKLSGLKDYMFYFQENTVLLAIVLFLLYLLQSLGLLLPFWYFVIRKYGLDIKQLGFIWVGAKKTVAWVFAAYVFYIGLSIFVITIFSALGIGGLGFEPQQSIFEFFGKDIVGILFAGFIAIILAPFIEEIFFRGFVLNTLVERVGAGWGIFLTALIFASVHFEFQSIVPLIILAVVLNVLYVKTKSIWPGILFHVFNNAVAFFVLLLL